MLKIRQLVSEELTSFIIQLDKVVFYAEYITFIVNIVTILLLILSLFLTIFILAKFYINSRKSSIQKNNNLYSHFVKHKNELRQTESLDRESNNLNSKENLYSTIRNLKQKNSNIVVV
uniref:DUF4083 domain-containing protein n=1 Tax=Strongyloides venezuelensis TaxID=75913 RepID=A0A0K0FYX9_STRVS